jgi:predicted phosphodiesterase
MPRLALIADIHANLEALHAVLADIARNDADLIVCLGDIVGYGPDPEQCVETVHNTCDRIILGNHDEAAAHPDLLGSFNPRARASLEFTQHVLPEEHLAALTKLPDRARLEGVSFAHASFGPDQYEYLYNEPAAHNSFSGLRTRIGAVGHTHIPTVCTGTPELGGTTSNISIHPLPHAVNRTLPSENVAIINPGSVGQPRDRNPDAAWALLDTERSTIRGFRVPYDIDAVLDKLDRFGLPSTLGERLLVGA